MFPDGAREDIVENPVGRLREKARCFELRRQKYIQSIEIGERREAERDQQCLGQYKGEDRHSSGAEAQQGSGGEEETASKLEPEHVRARAGRHSRVGFRDRELSQEGEQRGVETEQAAGNRESRGEERRYVAEGQGRTPDTERHRYHFALP